MMGFRCISILIILLSSSVISVAMEHDGDTLKEASTSDEERQKKMATAKNEVLETGVAQRMRKGEKKKMWTRKMRMLMGWEEEEAEEHVDYVPAGANNSHDPPINTHRAIPSIHH